MKTVLERRNELDAIMKDARQMKWALQEECDHPLYTARYDGNTGNWCESDDTYWVVIKCPDCEFSETVYSDDERPNKRFQYRGNHPRVIK